MKKTQKSKIFIAVSFLTVFAFATFISIIPSQTVEAAAPPNYIDETIYKNVSAHQHYYWLYSCFRNLDIDNVEEDEIDAWDYWGDDNGFHSTLGAMYGEGKQDGGFGGLRYCSRGSIVESALKYLGFTDPRDVFCKLEGYEYEDGQKGGYEQCVAGIGDHTWDNKSSNEDVAKSFEKLAQSKKPDFGEPEAYLRAYSTLVSSQGCKIQQTTDTKQYNTRDEVPGTNSGTIYAIPIVVAKSDDSGYDVRYVQGVGLASNHPNRYVATESGQNSSGDHYQNKTCGEVVNIARDNVESYAQKIKNSSGEKTDSGSDSDSGSTDPTCESEGGVLAWVLCGAIEVIDSFISWLDRQVNDLLYLDEKIYSNDTVDKAWSNMRNIALLILVPMMMFMVIGTALNFGPFDPYTVKKSLPRMFIAVVFIVLSLPITQFGVAISNTVGQGLGNIILSASGNEVRYLSDIFTDTPGGTQGGLGWAALIGGAVGFAVAGIGALLSFGAVAAVGLLIGFVILVMRQVLIVMLIVIAPLAILSWIFPGNDKLWGIWKGTFIALLLMYPIITMLLASGKFVAAILG